MSSHTPGPWTVGEHFGGSIEITGDERPDGSRAIIAGVCGGQWAPGPDTEANARLIAAAPDLLAACQAFSDANDSRTLWEAVQHARDAIALATDARQRICQAHMMPWPCESDHSADCA